MGIALISGILCTLSVLAIFVGIYKASERSDDMAERLEMYATVQQRETDDAKAGRKGLSRLWARLDRLLSGQGMAQKLLLHMAQANVRLTVPEFLAIDASVCIVGGVLGYVLRGQLVSAIGAGLLALFVPWVLLERRRSKRINAFHAQLVDVLTLIVGSLRGGHALPTALDLISRELDAPASEEFARVLQEVGVGLSQTQALNNLVKRMETDDLQLIVTAVNISHEVGGNLSLVLEKIAATLRERVQLLGEIRVLTTQQRLTSYLLIGMPFFLGGALAVISPSWIMRLFQPGWVRIIPAGAVVAEVIGFFVCQRLSRIEV